MVQGRCQRGSYSRKRGGSPGNFSNAVARSMIPGKACLRQKQPADSEAFMRVRDAMSPEVQLCTPDDTLKDAAHSLMAGHLRCDALALRRHVSIQLVQKRSLKEIRNSTACETCVHGFTLARNPRKQQMHALLSWIERYPPEVEATRSNRVGCAIALDGNTREAFLRIYQITIFATPVCRDQAGVSRALAP